MSTGEMDPALLAASAALAGVNIDGSRSPQQRHRMASRHFFAFRALTVASRLLVPPALVALGVVTGRWVLILVACVVLTITLTIAWTANEGQPEGLKRRIWWP
jgi:hypothetical protein